MLLTTSAIGLGAGLAHLAGVREVEGIKKFFGQTAKQQAENEEFDRTAKPGERVERTGLEWLGDRLYGRSQEDIEAAGLARDNKAINKTYENRLATVESALKGMGRQDLMPTLGDTETSAQFGAEIGDIEDRIKLLRQASTAGLDVTGYKGKSNEELRSFIAQQNPTGPIQTLKREKEARDEQKEYNKFLLARQDIQAANNRADAEARRAFEASEARANRQQTMQLAMMDRQDKMADRAYMRERDSAKDRQQSIMMLVKGLAQMGAGFAL